VVIELAPAFAPLHVANLRQLARGRYFDGLAIVRSQDNFVVQWGDPDGQRSLGAASATLPPEFTVRMTPGMPFERLPDHDGYAPEVGFSDGFPVGRDPARSEAWLAHCYAMVGAGRGNETDSGNGAELYVVTGHAPRQLDRNIALVGRVVQGMELLSTVPRGSGPLGFFEQPAERVPIASVRLAADVPAEERSRLQVLRTDSDSFRRLVEVRRNRQDDWYRVPAGYIDLCNVPLVARPAP
jgi:peptidylprolyl isomerase